MSSLGRTATILVIDDHVALAQGFAQALSEAGYTALVAHTADVAMREAQLHQPDAIILDFQMPFINGVGFLYRLRAQEELRLIPVLVITGHTLTDEVQAELRELGAEVRNKPMGLADLLIEAGALVQRGHEKQASESADRLPRI